MRWRGKGSKLSRALELYDRRPPRGGPLGRISTSRIRQRGGAPLPPSAARRPAGSAGAAEPRRGQDATRARESPNREGRHQRRGGDELQPPDRAGVGAAGEVPHRPQGGPAQGIPSRRRRRHRLASRPRRLYPGPSQHRRKASPTDDWLAPEHVTARRLRVVAVLGGLAIIAVVAGIFVLHGSWSGQVQDHPSCGHVVNSVNNYNAQVPGCLWRAYQAQETATGIMVNFTVEGDPITYTVTVGP